MEREHSTFIALAAEHDRLMALLAEQRARRLSCKVFSVERSQYQQLRVVMMSRAAIGRSKQLLAKPVYTSVSPASSEYPEGIRALLQPRMPESEEYH